MRLAAIVLVVAFALPAQAQSLAEKLDMARIETQVEIVLAEDAELRAFTFYPTFADGTLTLTGRVENDTQRGRVGELVQAVEGVTSVVNSVVVGEARVVDLRDLPAAPEAAADSSAELIEAEPEPEPVYHTVRRGDTLGAIARRYGVSVRQIQRLNGLRGTNIRVGKRLRVE